MEVKPGYKQTEVGVIPYDWQVKNVGALVTYTNGKAHEQDITDSGRFVVVNSKFISSEGVTRKYSDHCFCPTLKGDVLMVMSDVPNGRAIAKCYCVESDETYTVNQRICILSPRSIDGKLLFYKLNRNPFYLAFDDGAKQTNLRKDEVLSCPLGIPKSDDEQRAIAAALRDVDALISAQDEIIAKKRDLKQAAMQQLLTGKKRLPGFECGSQFKATDVGLIPEDWRLEAVGEISIVGRGRVISHREIAVAMSPLYPVYSSQTSDNGIMGYLDTFDFEGEYITWTTDGANAGTVFHRNGRFNCTNVCGTIKLKRDNASFVSRVLAGIAPRHVSRNLGNPKLMNDVMKRIQVPMPPSVAEQIAIAEVLSDKDAELAALEQRRDKTRALKQGMMQELLTGRTRLIDSGKLRVDSKR